MKFLIITFFALFSSLVFIKPTEIKPVEKHLEVKEKIQIEVWSDVICPFCFLGKKKLDKAITKLNVEDQVEIIFRSFQLTPEFPKNQSISSVEYYKEKGFSMSQMKRMAAEFTESGKGYGIEYNFDKTLLFNSFDAHRLLNWARELGEASKLKEALLIAYFTEGYDLSKQDILCQVVRKVGLDDKQAMAILKSDRYADKVVEDIENATRLGVEGVPFFLINGVEKISGAQDDLIFESTIKRALNLIGEK